MVGEKASISARSTVKFLILTRQSLRPASSRQPSFVRHPRSPVDNSFRGARVVEKFVRRKLRGPPISGREKPALDGYFRGLFNTELDAVFIEKQNLFPGYRMATVAVYPG